MNESFNGKVALVTGAGSGMGLATAKAFAGGAVPREFVFSQTTGSCVSLPCVMGMITAQQETGGRSLDLPPVVMLA